jgi:5-methylcytosine-specific restriction endonuclease McrA
LAHIAEAEARRLYLPKAYSSMFEYCVGELRLSRDEAFKRLRAARTARRFPAIFEAIADGRLHVSSVLQLRDYLTRKNADELLGAAAHKSRFEIQKLIAERFPRKDVPALLTPSPASPSAVLLVPAIAEAARQLVAKVESEVAPEPLAGNAEPTSAPSSGEPPRPRLTPLAPERYALQLTIGAATQEKLRHAQELLGHAIPSGDIAQVLDRALDALIAKLEKRKFAASAKPRPKRSRRARDGEKKSRHIPADVRRAVWQRDGGRCTFVSASGKRCESRTRLEFDHWNEFARGGEATVANLRLRCRAHNQDAAERTFGAEFMRGKRLEAAETRTRATKRAEVSERLQSAANLQAIATEAAEDRDVIPWLRRLGFRAEEVRRGAAACADIPQASLEQRLRAALYELRPCAVRNAPSTSGTRGPTPRERSRAASKGPANSGAMRSRAGSAPRCPSPGGS